MTRAATSAKFSADSISPPNSLFFPGGDASPLTLEGVDVSSHSVITFGGWVKIESLPATTTYDATPSAANFAGVRHAISADVNGLLKNRAIVVEEGGNFAIVTGSSIADPSSKSANPSLFSPLVTKKLTPSKWTFVAATYDAKVSTSDASFCF